MEWFEYAGLGVLLVTTILGIFYGKKWHKKWDEAVLFLAQLGDAFTKTSEALKDKKLTKEEAISLLKEWYEVYDAVRVFFPFVKQG